MVINEVLKYVDSDFSTLMGEFKLDLIGNRAICVRNFIKILSYTNEKISFKIKNNEVVIEGQNFKISEMSVHDAIVIGKINKIYMAKE